MVNNHCNIKSRLTEGVKVGANSPKPPTTEGFKSRPVQIPTDPPDSTEMLAVWGFLLAEALSRSPWSREASLFVDRAITREGGQANG